MKSNTGTELAHLEESAIKVDADFKTSTGSVKASGQAANIIAAGVATAIVGVAGIAATVILKDSGLVEGGNELLEVAEEAFNSFS